MFLKPHQTYLESQGLYQKICRLAQLRVEMKALQVEEDKLVMRIYDAMCPATEIIDLTFLRQQKEVTDEERDMMFVARWDEHSHSLIVHPAYVSNRFRPLEKEEERESTLSPAPLSLIEKEKEREGEEERRVKSEKLEVKSEELRVNSEELRVKSEELRVKSEELRVKSEELRVNSEELRVKNEELRVNSEELRVKNEELRVNSEELRVKNEELRVKSEELRVDGNGDDMMKRFMRFFNGVMDEKGAKIPRIMSMGEGRRKALKARCREYSKEMVAEVIRKAATAPFLNGAGEKGWVASIDWLLNPNNFCKVLEGNYYMPRKKHRGLTPEMIAINHEIERQQHEELHRRLDEQRRGAVTYEEYQRMKAEGLV